jgi:hypothetical protein
MQPGWHSRTAQLAVGVLELVAIAAYLSKCCCRAPSQLTITTCGLVELMSGCSAGLGLQYVRRPLAPRGDRAVDLCRSKTLLDPTLDTTVLCSNRGPDVRGPLSARRRFECNDSIVRTDMIIECIPIQLLLYTSAPNNARARASLLPGRCCRDDVTAYANMTSVALLTAVTVAFVHYLRHTATCRATGTDRWHLENRGKILLLPHHFCVHQKSTQPTRWHPFFHLPSIAVSS